MEGMMQTETRELVKSLEAIPTDKREGFTQVPKELEQAADEALGSAESVIVDRSTESGRNLLTWSKNERNKRKRARKKQRQARKKNRSR
jgi:hypothetical protein